MHRRIRLFALIAVLFLCSMMGQAAEGRKKPPLLKEHVALQTLLQQKKISPAKRRQIKMAYLQILRKVRKLPPREQRQALGRELRRSALMRELKNLKPAASRRRETIE